MIGLMNTVQETAITNLIGKGKPVDPFPYTDNPHAHEIWHFHAKYLTIIWIFSDIPILIGRYAKRWRYGYKVHSASMSFIIMAHLLIITMNTVNSELSTGKGNIRQRQPDHFKGVLYMVVFSVHLAMTGTVLESFYKSRNSKISLYKPILRRVHMLLGFAMWLAAKWTING